MSDTNRVALRYVEESTYGSVPAGPPTFTELRKTGESLHVEQQTARSNEIRDDRMTTDEARVGEHAAGSIDGEISYGAYDWWLNSALMSAAWSSEGAVLAAGTASAVNSGNKFTHTVAWTLTPTAGMWILVSGFTNAANNGYFRVVSADGTNIVVAGGTLTDEASATGITIRQGSRITTGTTLTSAAVEKEFADITGDGQFELFTGIFPDTMDMGLTKENVFTIAFGLLGQDGVSAAATAGDGTPTAAPTNDVLSREHAYSILENMTAKSVASFSFSLKNNGRAKGDLGSATPTGFGLGRIAIEGAFMAYYENGTLIDKFLNRTASALAFVLEDADGNAYVVDMPRVKYSRGQRVATGPDGDVMADMAYTALRDSTTGLMLQIVRFPAS